MRRIFLKNLGLQKDVIDKIMAVNGADIEAARAKSRETEGLSAEQDACLADKERRFAEQERRLADKERRFAEQDARLAEQESRLADKERRFAEQESRLADKERRFVEQESRLADKERRLAEQDTRLADKERRLAEQDARLEALGKSAAETVMLRKQAAELRAERDVAGKRYETVLRQIKLAAEMGLAMDGCACGPESAADTVEQIT